MSEAAGSSAAAKPSSRAETIARQKKEAELASQQHELQKQMDALEALKIGGVALGTLDGSLTKDLRLVQRDAELFDEIRQIYKDIDPVQLEPDAEDILDVEFWDHGVPEPAIDLAPAADKASASASPDAKKKQTVKQVMTSREEWTAAYRQLEIKFIKRAIYAHDLKQAYASKRRQVRSSHSARRSVSCSCSHGLSCMLQLKDALAKAENHSSPADVQQKVSTAVTVAVKAAVAKAKASKPCGCKTSCTSASCGCKRNGFACSPETCGCKDSVCQNPHSYEDSPAGLAAWDAAVAIQSAKARAALDASRQKAIVAKIALRAEGGHE